MADRCNPFTDGEEGLRVLRMLNGAQKSLDRGETTGKSIDGVESVDYFVHASAIIDANCNIGKNCKIQNNVSVYKGVTREDGVFCGPSMVFTNIYNPRAEIRKMGQIRPTLVKRGATIGANSTIVCGTTLGAYCFIDAGAVVNRNVLDHAIIVGNPGKQIGWVCECGER